MGKGIAFIIGGVVGAGIALLYAPRPGAETRAIVADKVEELWGEGQAVYTKSRTYVQEGVANVREHGIKTDELREKIDNARAVIAEQVAKNAAAARDTINDKMPAAAEKINHAAQVVKGKIENIATHGNKDAADTAAPEEPVISVGSDTAAATTDPAPGATYTAQ
jgi:gas vesicle protein